MGCTPVIKTDYQSFREAKPDNVLFVVNGSAETLSAVDISTDLIYNNLVTLGHASGSRGMPNDILVTNDRIYVLLSGQNSVESYDADTLDYKKTCYLKNGFNPLNFIPLGDSRHAFVTGFLTDEVVLVDLESMTKVSSIISTFEKVTLPADAHDETTLAATTTNALGDNKHRGTTAGAVLLNGAESRLYLTNVRYDSKILLTDNSGALVDYMGSPVRANGYFRQGTMSIIGFDATTLAADGGAPHLLREVDLETLYRDAARLGDYFPGDGLNPQSAMILDGVLHLVCTGTNGGSPRTFGLNEYLPQGYTSGDTVPGTDPDDGVLLVLSIASPVQRDNPEYLTSIDLGGSPSAFRNGIDKTGKMVFLAGVGGVQAYGYGSLAGEFLVLRGSDNPVLAPANPNTDFYSHLLFDNLTKNLHISFFSDSKLLNLAVSGPPGAPLFALPQEKRTGDGPGALATWTR